MAGSAAAVPLPKGAGGLGSDSVALCHQVTTLDRGRLTRRLGMRPAALLAAVRLGLRIPQDLDE